VGVSEEGFAFLAALGLVFLAFLVGVFVVGFSGYAKEDVFV